MLQEMVEEWEQCERKLAESRDWMEKTRTSLDALTNRRRPIRDQMALRDRAAADAAVQKAKIVMALEKLQVNRKHSSVKKVNELIGKQTNIGLKT